MVTYSYTVESNLQEAIDRVVADLRSNPTITSDIVINVTDGAYSGVTIPDGALFPLANTIYKLIIQSAGQYFPIIDYNLGSTDQNCGIDIGSGNTNVVIDGLKIQYFPVGIRASLNSHFLTVKNCIISNNRNAGILASEIDQIQIIQNIVLNGDYGIVVHLCKDAAVLFNTVFQNGAIATEKGKSISAVWLEGALDYGNFSTDTGVIHLIGNIIWNLCGAALTVFYDNMDNISTIVSNYNDIVANENSKYIVVEDRTFYRGAQSNPRLLFTSLSEWKSTGKDADSISVDPKFISAVRIRSDRNGYSLDLNLLPASPVLGKAPSFSIDTEAATTWLPSYVDTSDLANDILDNPRMLDGTAIGANDKPSSSGFFGQDIFTNPLDIETIKNCDVDPLADIVSNKIDIWYPSIGPGYFYSNEREFYLYAGKACKTIGELAVTVFRLPSRVALNKDITVLVKGVETENYDILYDDLYIYHKDLDVVTYDEEVSIDCYVVEWKEGGFKYQKATYLFKFKQGTTRFYLNDNYIPGAPVVITDDKSSPTDSDSISNREFSLVFDEFEQKTEVVFALNSNLIQNGQFDYDIAGTPYLWGSSGASVVTPSTPTFPVAGANVCALDDNGYISQLLPYTSGAYSLSWFNSTEGTGQLNYTLHCYDQYYDDLGFVVTGSIQPGNRWDRHVVILGCTGVQYSALIPDDINTITYQFIPEETNFIDFKIQFSSHQISILPLYLDGIQYEAGDHCTTYHRRPFLNELTVEYETKEGNYIDKHQALAPIRNYMTNGFIYIDETPAKVYNGPTDEAITTLYEWRWPEGRTNIIPWSRTKGKDKLLYRPNKLFNLFPIPKQEMIIPVSTIPSISEINILPTIPIARQGDPVGTSLTIIGTDYNQNPVSSVTYSLSIYEPRGNYPGSLFKRLYGLKQQLGINIVGRLDNAGIANLFWIPPDREDSLLTTKIPKPTASSLSNDRLCFIQTKYPVNLENHGNIIILDSDGNNIPYMGSEYITVTKVVKRSQEYSKVQLEYPVAPGTISVTVENVKLKETSIATPESDQFFIDYENGEVIVKSKSSTLTVEYKPLYVIVNKTNAYFIGVYFDKVFADYSIGDIITVGYDYTITLQATITDPSSSSAKTELFELVAQNCLLSETQILNSLSLEM